MHNWRHERIFQSVGILCLTRSPMNPLMWAHYGVNHTGIVIGYEIPPEDDFFNSNERSIITAEEGSVIYSQTKPNFELNNKNKELVKKIRDLTIIRSQYIENDVRNALRNFFLYKHSVWSYEEEVRIVKIFENNFDKKTIAYIGQHELDRPYAVIGRGSEDAPNGSHCIFEKNVNIKEVYLGARCKISPGTSIYENIKHLKCNLYQLSIDKKSWSLKEELINF